MKERYWDTHELVMVGVFAVTAKVTSLFVALLSGGVNPLGLIVKNVLYTSLLIILLYKVPKVGALCLFTVITAFVSILLFGSSLVLIPGISIAAIVAESIAYISGGYGKKYNIILAVFIYDLLSRLISIGSAWLLLHENTSVLIIISGVIGLGYIGALLGLCFGVYSVRELRYAGIIKE